MTYTPDKWVIVEFHHWSDIFFKVFATWNGGYLTADEWRMNSGIVSVVEDGDYYIFRGHSGSDYRCHKKGYGTTGYGLNALNGFAEGITRERIEYKVHSTMEVLDDRDWIVFLNKIVN